MNCYVFMKLFGSLDVEKLRVMPEVRFQKLVDCINKDPEFKKPKDMPSGDKAKFFG